MGSYEILLSLIALAVMVPWQLVTGNSMMMYWIEAPADPAMNHRRASPPPPDPSPSSRRRTPVHEAVLL